MGQGTRFRPGIRAPGFAPCWLSALGQVWASGLCLLTCAEGLKVPVSERTEGLATVGSGLLGWPLLGDSGFLGGPPCLGWAR